MFRSISKKIKTKNKTKQKKNNKKTKKNKTKQKNKWQQNCFNRKNKQKDIENVLKKKKPKIKLGIFARLGRWSCKFCGYCNRWFDGAICCFVKTYGPIGKACEREQTRPRSVATNGWSGPTIESSNFPSIASFPLNLKW